MKHFYVGAFVHKVCVTMIKSHGMLSGHDDRVVREVPMNSTKHERGDRPRVSFKKQPVKLQRRNLDIFVQRILDDDIPMSTGSNNNAREVSISQGRGRGIQRGRNSPLCHRGGMRSRMNDFKRLQLEKTTWHSGTRPTHGFRITVSIFIPYIRLL